MKFSGYFHIGLTRYLEVIKFWTPNCRGKGLPKDKILNWWLDPQWCCSFHHIPIYREW